MRAVLGGLIGVVLSVGAAAAKDAIYEANGRVLSATLTIKRDATSTAVANYTLISHGCVGEISGRIVDVSASEMLLTADPVGGRQCTIKIRKNGRSLSLQESDGSECSNFHGAGCSFAQVLSLRR